MQSWVLVEGSQLTFTLDSCWLQISFFLASIGNALDLLTMSVGAWAWHLAIEVGRWSFSRQIWWSHFQDQDHHPWLCLLAYTICFCEDLLSETLFCILVIFLGDPFILRTAFYQALWPWWRFKDMQRTEKCYFIISRFISARISTFYHWFIMYHAMVLADPWRKYQIFWPWGSMNFF